MGLNVYQVDAFTDKPFFGNPAGVCVLSESVSDDWMQNVAKEMNLSETAFLKKQDDGYRLRWFTPTVEVDLCGHATLASAHILWEQNYLSRNEAAIFHTRSGVLTAKQTDDGWIELNFPVEQESEATSPKGLLESLGVQPKYIGKNRFDYIIEVSSEKEVSDLKPDFTALGMISCRGVIVTSLSESKDYDFVSRFFAPGVGVNEDPVTGSAHCCLGPYWKKRLGKDNFKAHQVSERGGILKVNVNNDRVQIAGKAITVMKAELLCSDVQRT
jgi:PhzF family phenazine biosynthesis protein